MENFETETHTKELNLAFESAKEEVKIVETTDFLYDLKTQFRFFRKQWSSFVRKNLKKDFNQILIITKEKPNFGYVLALKKQYPDKEIKFLVPIDNAENLEKTNISFEFFAQNKMNEARLYKFPRNSENIEVFGLFTTAFSSLSEKDFSKLQYLALFIKAVRICAKKLKPDIIHADNVPFFLGAEFESKMSYPIRVLQIFEDFYTSDEEKIEPFWAILNIASPNAMKKLCRDKIIQKCVASLFNLHNTNNFRQMRDCLEFIYQNYMKFRDNINKDEEIDENILFKRMNARVLKLFPEIRFEDNSYYDTRFFTLKKVDFWATISKSYYNSLFENYEFDLQNRIKQTKLKSGYVGLGTTKIKPKIYQNFDEDNFRELRGQNKTYLLKEFSSQRVKTKFMDIRLFKEENYVVKGYLDSFYGAPLIFAKFSNDVFKDGIDIAFSTILKLFELRKNMQVIVNIPEGLKNNYVKSWVEFMENNSTFDGRWVFIDGEINAEQFYASSDIMLLPRRLNSSNVEYLKGMNLGCIPVASRTGILNDTITDIFDDMVLGCGFKTRDLILNNEKANDDYASVLTKALNLYTNNPSSWNLLIKNAMNYDSSWNFEIIEKYNELYELL